MKIILAGLLPAPLRRSGMARQRTRAIAGFLPDCIVLLSRVARDPGVPRRRAWPLVGVLAYLASPIDLIPDFIPGLGQLDDALVVALALRWALRDLGEEELEAHWPGPSGSLGVVLRLAGASP